MIAVAQASTQLQPATCIASYTSCFFPIAFHVEEERPSFRLAASSNSRYESRLLRTYSLLGLMKVLPQLLPNDGHIQSSNDVARSRRAPTVACTYMWTTTRSSDPYVMLTNPYQIRLKCRCLIPRWSRVQAYYNLAHRRTEHNTTAQPSLLIS